jgi:hypothetical protein
MNQNRAVLIGKVGKTTLVVMTALVLLLGTGIVILARHWPFSEKRVTQSLQESFPATVTFEKFHSTHFPHPGCVGEGVVFKRLGGPPGTPPVVTIEYFRIEGHYTDLLWRPNYLARIVTKGLRVNVPPLGTSLAESGWKETGCKLRVGEIIADGAVIEIARAHPHAALRFDIHKLKLTSVSRNQAMGYTVSFHNPLPPGDVRAKGKFGPWNSNDAGQTPVSGQYTFENADLGVFGGIGGMLSAEDKFQGVLGHIETRGSIDIPDFKVTRGEHPVHVKSNFHAFVNGTNGDVELESVSAGFLKTQVLAKGKIAVQTGEDGKTASVDFIVPEGRIQDVLGLFVHEAKAPLNGTTSFRAHVVIPSEQLPFVKKVRLTGDFGIAQGQFAKGSTQASVNDFSERARGEKPKEGDPPTDPEEDRVISDIAGHVELRNATATFTNLSFVVPGASARMQGTYNLENKKVDLHGTLKTEAELSHMSSGFKSVLLKPFNTFFERKHVGAVVPVHLIGTYENPQPGLDLPGKDSNATPPARN